METPVTDSYIDAYVDLILDGKATVDQCIGLFSEKLGGRLNARLEAEDEMNHKREG